MSIVILVDDRYHVESPVLFSLLRAAIEGVEQSEHVSCTVVCGLDQFPQLVEKFRGVLFERQIHVETYYKMDRSAHRDRSILPKSESSPLVGDS